MKKKLLSVLLAMVMVLCLAACGGGEKPADGTTAAAGDDKEAIKVCVVYSGKLGDKSYNDSCNEGATKAATDFGVEIKSLEGTVATEWEANFLSACEDGYDLVICSSSNFQPYLEKYAPSYPDVKFAIIDTTVPGDNIVSISFAQNQGSFLAGAAAAMFTEHAEIEGVNEEAIIGWVGGMEIPVLEDFYIGYEAGAKYINPDIQILKTFVGAWDNPLEGKNHTLAKYDAGADIVMNVASGTGVGVLEGAKEAGKYAIGVDLNQDYDQPGSILTSMVKRVDTACYSVIEQVVNGTFAGGSVSYLDVAGKGVSLTDFAAIKEALGEQFPEEIITKITEIEEKIVSGEIVVPNYEGFGPQN
jgi:basic membrane protein A